MRLFRQYLEQIVYSRIFFLPISRFNWVYNQELYIKLFLKYCCDLYGYTRGEILQAIQNVSLNALEIFNNKQQNALLYYSFIKNFTFITFMQNLGSDEFSKRFSNFEILRKFKTNDKMGELTIEHCNKHREFIHKLYSEELSFNILWSFPYKISMHIEYNEFNHWLKEFGGFSMEDCIMTKFLIYQGYSIQQVLEIYKLLMCFVAIPEMRIKSNIHAIHVYGEGKGKSQFFKILFKSLMICERNLANINKKTIYGVTTWDHLYFDDLEIPEKKVKDFKSFFSQLNENATQNCKKNFHHVNPAYITSINFNIVPTDESSNAVDLNACFFKIKFDKPLVMHLHNDEFIDFCSLWDANLISEENQQQICNIIVLLAMNTVQEKINYINTMNTDFEPTMYNIPEYTFVSSLNKWLN